MGGFSNAIADATGKDPSAYFVDMRNKYQSKVQNAEEAIWQEARSTLLNPKYIQELQQEGASAAEVFAESVRNTYGWNAMRPDAIDDELWNELHEVYVKDKYQMGMKDYFRNKNPFAMQEVTAVMLETARKGLWQATPEQIALLTTTHFEMIREFNPACSGFVCNNAKLQEYIGENLPDLDRSTYVSAIEGVRQSAESNQDVRKSIALEKQANDSTDPKEKGASSNPIAKKPKDSNKPETSNSNLPFVLLFVSLFGLTAISVLLFARSRIG
jgi:cobaltochelatase CobN